MHLARADGILWLLGLLGLVVYEGVQRTIMRVANKRGALMAWVGPVFACLVGYLAVMAFWYVRNLETWGSLFPPGGGRTLWLTRYEDLFIYPGSLLTPQRWLASGIGAILRARWDALVANLQTLVAVQGSIALFPFMLVGLWQMRRERMVQFAGWMWLVIFAAFTLVFPFAGINGSFFHSGAAVQLVFWAAAPLGIEKAVGYVARLRKWERGRQVQRFVEALLTITFFLLSTGLLFQHIMGSNQPDEEDNSWASSGRHYQAIENQLLKSGADSGERVMVNNPPGYFLASDREAVVVPFGDQAMVLAAASHYQVRYLILDENDSGHLPVLYQQLKDQPGFHFMNSLGTTRIYEIIP
jgi:hypothetical protein